MHLFGTDRVLLREIADGLAFVEGGRVASLLPLMSAGLVAGERVSQADALAYQKVVLTSRGLACLYPPDMSPQPAQDSEASRVVS